MSDDEIVAGVTLQQMYDQMLHVSRQVDELTQTFKTGNFESRLRNLEQFKWKLIGAIAAVNGVGAVIIAFLVK